jgi:hypothetical protein
MFSIFSFVGYQKFGTEGLDELYQILRDQATAESHASHQDGSPNND